MKLRSPDVVHHHVLEFLTTRSHYGVGLPKKEATVVSIKLKQTNKQTNKNPTTTAATKEKQQNQTSCSHKRCFLIKTGTESVSKQNKTKNKQKNFRTKVPSLFSVFPFFPTFFLSSSPVSSPSSVCLAKCPYLHFSAISPTPLLTPALDTLVLIDMIISSTRYTATVLTIVHTLTLINTIIETTRFAHTTGHDYSIHLTHGNFWTVEDNYLNKLVS